MNKELLVLLAASMSKEDIIERIEEALAKFKESELLGNDSTRDYKEILCMCHMAILNHESDGNIQGAMKILSQMDNLEKREKLFNVNNKQN